MTAPAVGRRTKVAYGLGSMALAVRDTGFNTFILIFYNQVLGLSAALAGLALMLTLVADAVFDPLVGLVSDSWRSRLGRRHPFMFAAAIPAAASFALLWNVPAGVTGPGLFWWLLATSVLARACMSLFEVPYVSLAAGLTSDYEQRTSLISWCYAFGWWTGLALSLAAYGIFLRPSPGDPAGMFSRHGFAAFGLTGSVVLVLAMTASAAGTWAANPAQDSRGTGGPSRAPMTKTLRAFATNPSLVALLIAVVLLSIGDGFSTSVYNYLQVFFWGLNASQLALLSLVLVIPPGLALVLAPRLGKGREKRDLAIGLALVGAVGQPVPVVLRLLGLLPAKGAPILVPILGAHSAFETTVWVLFAIVTSSMVADLADDHQRRTGDRAEGALFALRIFAQKTTSGLGVLTSGLVLTAVGFPAGARHDHLSGAVIAHLGLAYAILMPALGLTAVVALRGYRLTRAGHARNLEVIAQSASRGASPSAGALSAMAAE